MLVDADACPVKSEIYDIAAARHGVNVIVVANTYMRVPRTPLIRSEVVSDGFDAADDRIAELAAPGSVAITTDILLADRCLKAGADVLSPSGKPFTDNSIGSAVATRAIMQDLRAGAGSKSDERASHIGGPAPFSNTDRARFKSALHETLERLKRG